MKNEETKSPNVIGLVNSLGAGGAERQMLFLAEQGIIGATITLEAGKSYDASVPITALLNENQFPKLLRFVLIPYYAWRLRNLVSRNQTVVSFTERSNFVNIIAKLFVCHRAVVSVRTNPNLSYRGIKRIQILLMRILYQFADMIVTNSKDVRVLLVSRYGMKEDRVVAIQNGIDTENIQEQARIPINPGDESFFVSGKACIVVGRFEKPKGQWHAIRAWKRVMETLPDASLLLIGEGSMRTELKKLTDSLGLSSSVHFLGHQKNPYSYIRRANCLLLPSLWEGMPNVVLESLACGTPVVATDCDFGPREILMPHLAGDVQEPIYGTFGALTPAWGNLEADTLSSALTVKEELYADAIVTILQRNDAQHGVDLPELFTKSAVVLAWREIL